jgi:hypothetical protein
MVRLVTLPPDSVQESIEEFPFIMLNGVAVKLVIAGFNTVPTVTVVETVATP